MRQDAGPDAVGYTEHFWHRICEEHSGKFLGVLCPVCNVIEEKDRQIALLEEKITELKGTIAFLEYQSNSPGW